MRDFPVARSNRAFLLRGVNEVARLDGRSLFEYRDVTLRFGQAGGGCCRVALGDTLVLAHVSHDVVEPRSQRASEGLLTLNLELSAMSSAAAEPGRPSDEAVLVSRALERCLRDSKFLDLESLCIVAGEKVFQIRVDVRVLNHAGNLVDACALAAVAAMAHYRRPDVSVSGKDVLVHDKDGRERVPLMLRFLPIVQSFGLFDAGKLLVADPDAREEQVMDGRVVVAMNVHRELCCLLTQGQLLLQPDQLLRCTAKAAAKVRGLTNLLTRALAQDATALSSTGVLAATAAAAAADDGGVSDMLAAARLAHGKDAAPTLEDGEVESASDEELNAEAEAVLGVRDLYDTAEVCSEDVANGLRQLRSTAAIQSGIDSAIRSMRLEATKQLPRVKQVLPNPADVIQQYKEKVATKPTSAPTGT